MDRYLLIFAPDLRRDEPFVRFDARDGTFHEALTSQRHGVELLHPKTSVPSFPFWLAARGGRTELSVSRATLQNAFESPEHNAGWMFLVRPVHSDLRLTFQNAQYHYRRMTSQGLGLQPSLFWHPSLEAMGGRLLHEHRSPGTELESWSIGVGAPDRAADGWMNPLVLRFDVSGSACEDAPAHAPGNDTRRVLHSLRQRGRVLAIVPEFDAEASVRCRAWGRLLRARSGSLNAIERLVAGAAQSHTCREAPEPHLWSFFGLDALAGSFVLDGHGQGRGSPSNAGPEYRWCAPPELAPNGRWLAEQLVSRWAAGESLLLPQRASAGATSERRGHSSADNHCRFSLASSDQRSSVNERARVITTTAIPVRSFAPITRADGSAGSASPLDGPSSFVSFCAEQATTGDDGTRRIARYFAALIEELKAHELGLPPHLHEAWLQPTDDGLRADVPGFLNALAQRLVAPRSSLLVRLPQQSGLDEACYLDLSRSVPHAHRALLWGMLRTPRGARRARALPATMGWWNDWHSSLFDDAADVQLELDDMTFRLGRARLGEALGRGQPHTAAAHIRFAVPS